MKKTLRATTTDILSSSLVDVHDWRSSIIQNLNQLCVGVEAKNSKDFVVIYDELYYRGCGILLIDAFLSQGGRAVWIP